jgi:ubiquitin-like-conjugating enzyme ATG3
MKKVIERMNASVIEEQQAQRKGSGAAAAGSKDKDKQKKWLFRRASGNNVKTDATDEDVEGMRVDFYLVVFLKFIASIVPTIEVDSTTSF